METEKYVGKWNGFKQSREFKEFYFFAVALVLAFGILSTTGTQLDTDRPVVTVISCSMYPALDVGDILIVKGVPFESIEEGDIIVYDAPDFGRGVPIVHRVIDAHPNYVETQGDNVRVQQDFEKRINPSQIYGKVLFRVPKIGIVKLLAMDLAGYSPNDKPLVLDATPQCVDQT